jgi:hypothetical protein
MYRLLFLAWKSPLAAHIDSHEFEHTILGQHTQNHLLPGLIVLIYERQSARMRADQESTCFKERTHRMDGE